MAFYDVRDLIGHWVKPRSAEGEMCPHACCRGFRPHPDNFPVILSARQLRGSSERQLVYHLRKHGGSDRAVRQVVGELDRRENVTRRAARARERARGRRASADAEFRAHLENEWARAEEQTRGYMLNRAGQRAGVDERSLFTGPESRVRKYASEELRRYFEGHPRVSRAEFLGGHAAQLRGGRTRRESALYGVY